MLRNGSSVGRLYGMTQFEEYVWWSDQTADALRRAPKRATASNSIVKITSSGINRPSAVQVVHPYRQPEQGISCHTGLSVCLSIRTASIDP